MSQNLSLENTVVSVELLLSPPSVRDGFSKELEYELRIVGCELIQSMGILLKLPQVAMATAQVLLQRFYYCASFKQFKDIALGAIFLASKLEECPARIRDIIHTCHYLETAFRGQEHQPIDPSSTEIPELNDALINAESQILVKLGFNVHVQHPHGFMINYLRSLGMADNREMAQQAWNYVNDRTNCCVCYQPSTIACAAIYLAARVLQIKLPTSPPWWEVFEASDEDILFISTFFALVAISGCILKLYRTKVEKSMAFA
ncbi:cyclin-like protein [Polychytrium aggregatum]|uniref:cyclin-like protein n=1 Tax=Polychytrium aggregatum TaxID=110093 RepID=UPI0022FDBCDC|nr:cyclin-like protein [Polychytrium aggregatum]KAI9208543.1 cyclin-like protein [Polychytrium aggregatum]